MAIIWCKNFEIPRVDLNICSESAIGFHTLQSKTVGRNIINESIWVFKNLDNIGTYFFKRQLRKIIEKTLSIIINQPGKIDILHQKTILYNKKYYIFAEKIRKLSLKKLTTKQLLSWHKKLFYWQYLSHGYSLPTTWFVDSDGEDLTKHLTRLIKMRIEELGLTLSSAVVFSKLTTPTKQSLAQKEELESLAILKLIKKHKSLAKKLSYLKKTTSLLSWLESCPKALNKVIIKHYKKWCWFPYTYLGPAYSLDYYLQVWQGLLRERVNSDREIAKIISQSKKAQTKRSQLLKILKPGNHLKHLLIIASDIVWLKGYRKDCYYHGFYVLDILLAEIARRTNLSLLQVKYLLPEELPLLLLDNNKDWADLANQRMKFSVLYHKDSQVKILVGKKAKQFLSKRKFEKISIKKTKEILGTCACPGQVSGRVCLVNIPADMVKMKKGDIMVSHTTYPALIPAMKLAAGLITEDGGVTCHAAIVARELQIPCVVGTKIAAQVLKDGDRVEVQAEQGIIKVIK
ncbi:hypothetical protein KKC17_03150 [Patescibacteria group bacterium]|nr:hypothetical protein [Patescibacteria group bacterium]